MAYDKQDFLPYGSSCKCVYMYVLSIDKTYHDAEMFCSLVPSLNSGSLH